MLLELCQRRLDIGCASPHERGYPTDQRPASDKSEDSNRKLLSVMAILGYECRQEVDEKEYRHDDAAGLLQVQLCVKQKAADDGSKDETPLEDHAFSDSIFRLRPMQSASVRREARAR